MNSKHKITLDDAYAIESPTDNIRLYGDWADTYDVDFVESENYVYHLRVAEVLLTLAAELNGVVLDVGCGTGVVGVALRNGGIAEVDGIDISSSMLAQSRKKLTDSGEPVYGKLIEADLTTRIDIEDNSYGGLISSGTFTLGHLGPESLDELWRVAAPGAVCVIGVNSKYYDPLGFGEKFAADAASGIISNPDFFEVDMYAAAAIDNPHGADTALIAICRLQ